jgi:hypothetical protein
MAPEQWKEQGQVDGRADVYALGVIAFLGLTGRLPFQASDVPALGMMHCYTEPPSLIHIDPSVPSSLAAFVTQMLEKDPARRPSMATVAETLGRFLPDGTTAQEQSDDILSLEILPGSLEPVVERPATVAVPRPMLSRGSLGILGLCNLIKGVRRRTWVSVTAFIILLTSGVCVLSWRRPSRRMVRPPELSAALPRLPPSPPAVAQRIDIGQPQRAPQMSLLAAPPRLVPRRSCKRILPRSACIRNMNLNFDQRMLLLRAFYRRDARFCAGERLILSGLPAAPRLLLAPRSMPPRVWPDLALELRSLLGGSTMPPRIEILCSSFPSSVAERSAGR